MSFIKNLLMEKKLMEVSEDVDAFLEKNNIGAGTLVQSIEFSKDKYKTSDQVADFLTAHYISEGITVADEKEKYSAVMYDPIGFIAKSLKGYEIREGVSVVVGQLRDMDQQNPILFKEHDNGNIKLSSTLPYIIELAKVVTGYHARYGEVKITKSDLKSFKDNFDKKVNGTDVSIDFDHDAREAAGWLTEVFLSEDKQSLFGAVKWTPKGALSLSDREFRYFSPEFSSKFVHPHTGINHGPTLTGGALVNRPFLRMEAIVELKDKNKQPTKENLMETISLSDHKAKVSDFEKQISELQLSDHKSKDEVKTLKEENVKLSDAVKTMQAEQIKKESEARHQKLFDDGKINAAQLKSLKDGGSLIDVLTLSDKMNTKAAGTGAKGDVVQLSDDEKAMCLKMGLSEEDYIKFGGE